MAPPKSRPKAARPAPPAGGAPADDETLAAAIRWCGVQPDQVLDCVVYGSERLVVVTIDGRKLVWEA